MNFKDRLEVRDNVLGLELTLWCMRCLFHQNAVSKLSDALLGNCCSMYPSPLICMIKASYVNIFRLWENLDTVF